jgi:ubiquinone/menaquinone biosynthesis C-methylase UbiE
MTHAGDYKDHFSTLASEYSRHRPGYPRELIDWIASLAPARTFAVDCATGNGQAAVALADRFDAVLAVDASAEQLAQAVPHPRVRYERALAEALPVADRSVALVAVAQAVHWFDFDRFHAECRRVLAPRGILAAWTYTVFRAGPAVDAIVDRFYHGTVAPYWPPERRYVQEGYRTLPFPWEDVVAPRFTLATEWTLDQTLGYFATWSSVMHYRRAHGGDDPLPALRDELAPAWPAGATLRLVWPLHVRVGRAAGL